MLFFAESNIFIFMLSYSQPEQVGMQAIGIEILIVGTNWFASFKASAFHFVTIFFNLCNIVPHKTEFTAGDFIRTHWPKNMNETGSGTHFTYCSILLSFEVTIFQNLWADASGCDELFASLHFSAIKFRISMQTSKCPTCLLVIIGVYPFLMEFGYRTWTNCNSLMQENLATEPVPGWSWCRNNKPIHLNGEKQPKMSEIFRSVASPLLLDSWQCQELVACQKVCQLAWASKNDNIYFHKITSPSKTSPFNMV